MNDKLARKLKDAGFPQPLITWSGEEKPLHYPTLSNLIAECGDEFGKLELSPFRECACIWDARPKNEQINGEHADKWTGRGDTPEEAVANLWLKLNEK